MMGVYSMALGLAGALGAALSVPLEHALGSWRPALALWAIPAVASAALWFPFARRARAAAPAEPVARVTLWHDALAWRITGYMSCQSVLFYIFAAWLPDILKSHGFSDAAAGFLLSLELVVGISTSLVVPMIAERLADQRLLGAGAAALWLAGILGLLLSPEAGTVAWVLLIGFGQGAGISLVLTLFALRGRDGRSAAALSGMAQTVGYLVAATGPLSVGALHDATGGWTAPLLLTVVYAIAMMIFGLGAGRPGFVEARELRAPQLR
jgi:CP family cyanate transporter-like MFS transporter